MNQNLANDPKQRDKNGEFGTRLHGKSKQLGWSDEKSNPRAWLEEAENSESEEDLFNGKSTRSTERLKATVAFVFVCM